MILFLSLFFILSSLESKEHPIAAAASASKNQKLAIPEERAYRIPTLNNYGYMFTKFDPLTKLLLKKIQQDPNISIFEVGGAYGNVAEAALELGIKRYDLNDIELRHLQAFANKLQKEGKHHFFSSLSLIPGRCPDEVKIASNSYDAILVNKVLHFFTPDTIDSFILWLRNGLKANGKVYILTISPFYKGHESLLKSYNEKQALKERFPGYCPSYHASEPGKLYPQQARPNSLLFMELETLKNLFIQHGFSIENEYELSIIDSKTSEWSSGKDMVGIVATKID